MLDQEKEKKKKDWNLTFLQMLLEDATIVVSRPRSLATYKQEQYHFLQDKVNLLYHEFTSIDICITHNNMEQANERNRQVIVLESHEWSTIKYT